MVDRIAMIDRLARYLCRRDSWNGQINDRMEERWTRDIELYRAAARKILDEPEGWKTA